MKFSHCVAQFLNLDSPKNLEDFDKKWFHEFFSNFLGHLSLPETEAEIEEEIRKQESLLADLHLQISSGAASKKTEEQIWEQQRIVTQLKRNLRNAKKGHSLENEDGQKPKYEPIGKILKNFVKSRVTLFRFLFVL